MLHNYECGRILPLWLQRFDLHHHSQLRHEFGRLLLRELQQFDLHLYASLHTSQHRI